jgi:hypothetical protein
LQVCSFNPPSLIIKASITSHPHSSSLRLNHHQQHINTKKHQSIQQPNMHFATLLSLIAPLASAVTLSYDAGYADGTRSLTAVSCSDGANGLINRYGWSKQSDIPRFPYVGGSSDIAGWNSPSCGQCYKIEYPATGKSIFLLAIDHTANGMNVSPKAMDDLTNNQAVSDLV